MTSPFHIYSLSFFFFNFRHIYFSCSEKIWKTNAYFKRRECKYNCFYISGLIWQRTKQVNIVMVHFRFLVFQVRYHQPLLANPNSQVQARTTISISNIKLKVESRTHNLHIILWRNFQKWKWKKYVFTILSFLFLFWWQSHGINFRI